MEKNAAVIPVVPTLPLIEAEQPTEKEKPTLTHSEAWAVWLTIFLPLIAFIAAIILLWNRAVFPTDLWLMGAMYSITVLGITMGFHRLFTHHSFKCGPTLRVLLAVAGSMALQGPVSFWVASHRRHHQHSDELDDPHSPHFGGGGFFGLIRGWWHAHMGWMLKHLPDVNGRLVADIARDPAVAWVSRSFLLWAVVGIVLPGIIGGLITWSWFGFLSGMLWGGFARVFLVHHVTWSINSVCHLWGRKEFKTEDESRNNAFCALFSFGEGWHNNHHAFPTSARHGLRWWQFDITWILICALNAVGLVWDIRTPDARQLEERSAANVAARAAAGAASAATSIAELTEPAEQAAQAESQINEADRAA